MVKKVGGRAAPAPLSQSNEPVAAPASPPPTPRTRLRQWIRAPYRLLGMFKGVNAGKTPFTLFEKLPAAGASKATAPTQSSYQDYATAIEDEGHLAFQEYNRMHQDVNDHGFANRIARARHMRSLKVAEQNGVDLSKPHDGRTALQDARRELKSLRALQKNSAAPKREYSGYLEPLPDYEGKPFAPCDPSSTHAEERQRAGRYARRIQVLEDNIRYLENIQESKWKLEFEKNSKKMLGGRDPKTALTELNKGTPADREKTVRAWMGVDEKTRIPATALLDASLALTDFLNGKSRPLGATAHHQQVDAEIFAQRASAALNQLETDLGQLDRKLTEIAGVESVLLDKNRHQAARPQTSDTSVVSPTIQAGPFISNAISTDSASAHPSQPAAKPVPLASLTALFAALEENPASSPMAGITPVLQHFIQAAARANSLETFDAKLRAISQPVWNNVHAHPPAVGMLDRLLARYIIDANPANAAEIVTHLKSVIDGHRPFNVYHPLPQAAIAITMRSQLEHFESAGGTRRALPHEQSQLTDSVLKLIPDTFSVTTGAAFLQERIVPVCENGQGRIGEEVWERIHDDLKQRLTPEDVTQLRIPLDRIFLGPIGARHEKKTSLYENIWRTTRDEQQLSKTERDIDAILAGFEAEIQAHGFDAPALGQGQCRALFGDFSMHTVSTERDTVVKNSPRLTIAVHGHVTDMLAAWRTLHANNDSSQLQQATLQEKLGYFHALRSRIALNQEIAHWIFTTRKQFEEFGKTLRGEFIVLLNSSTMPVEEKHQKLSTLAEKLCDAVNQQYQARMPRASEILNMPASANKLPHPISRIHPPVDTTLDIWGEAFTEGIRSLRDVLMGLLPAFTLPSGEPDR